MAEQMGKWLPIISRVAMRVVFGESSLTEEHHWNIVQNNGNFPISLTAKTEKGGRSVCVLSIIHLKI
jgi:hypothetical protein